MQSIKQSTKRYSIRKISNTKTGLEPKSYFVEDTVVFEEPLEIWLTWSANPKPPELLFTTMRTPGDDINLVRGWLYSSGAIENVKQILSITHTGTGRLKQQPTNRVLVTLTVEVDMKAYQRLEVVNSACGVCGQQSIEDLLEKLNHRTLSQLALSQLAHSQLTHSQFTPSQLANQKLPIASIAKLGVELRAQQSIFEKTGGSHGAGLFDNQFNLLDVREDVGRHNALDKLIGANLKNVNEVNSSLAGIVLSGRISFELVQKSAMAGFRYIIAMGAPSSLAIDVANDCDICLIGFVKSTGSATEFNVYSCTDMLV